MQVSEFQATISLIGSTALPAECHSLLLSHLGELDSAYRGLVQHGQNEQVLATELLHTDLLVQDGGFGASAECQD
jgi:hypothetical protein